MADVVVTCPARLWHDWLAEGDCAGDEPTGDEYAFTVGFGRPNIAPGERVYVVALGMLRGYAPLVRLEPWLKGWALIRAGGAVPVTVPCPVGQGTHPFTCWDTGDAGPCCACESGVEVCPLPARVPGFRAFRYRWWKREDEVPFPNWRQDDARSCGVMDSGR